MRGGGRRRIEMRGGGEEDRDEMSRCYDMDA